MAGQVQVLIADALAYSTRVVQDAKAATEYLTSLLPEYQKRPALVLQDFYQKALEEILQNVDEKIFLPPNGTEEGREIRVLINRDLKAKKPAKSEQQ